MLICLICLPEGLSFLFGIFIDSVSIFGKRGHILLAAALQMITSIILCTVKFHEEDNISGFVIAAIFATVDELG